MDHNIKLPIDNPDCFTSFFTVDQTV